MSNNLHPISNVDIGTDVLVGIYDDEIHSVIAGEPTFKVKLIGRHNKGQCCVGWNGYTPFRQYYGRDYFDCWTAYDYTFIPGWRQTFEYVMWVGGILHIQIVEKPVLHAEQKCEVCTLPAPHVSPNKDGKFVCAPCAFLVSL